MIRAFRKNLLPVIALVVPFLLLPISAPGFQGLPKEKGSIKAGKSAAKVDLNHATAEKLQELPQVGPATARKIIENRPYASFKELEEKAGLNARVIDAMKGRISFGSARPAPASTTETAKRKAEPKKSSESTSSRKSTAKEAREPTSGIVNINTAGAAELETLPGVGPFLAQAIIEGRPYTKVEDLEKVKGFGPAKLAQIRNLVTTGPAAATAPSSPKAPAARGDRARTEVKKEGTQRAHSRSATAPPATPKREIADDEEEHVASKPPLAPGQRINLNTATLQELQALPGIGPVKAQAIIDARPYTSVEDVMRARGVKQKTFAKLKDHVRVK